MLGLALCAALAAVTDFGKTSRAKGQSRPPACEADVELVALVYAENDPDRSMALVGAKRSRLVRIGSWIGDRQVIAMGPRSLVLGPVDDPCMARLKERSKHRPATRSKPRRRRSRRR